jgi:hypothetical protein
MGNLNSFAILRPCTRNLFFNLVQLPGFARVSPLTETLRKDKKITKKKINKGKKQE